MVDHAFKLNVGRQGFGSVNPEIRIIEGRIIEVLLYIEVCIKLLEKNPYYRPSFNQFFNYPTSNPLSKPHLNLLF